MAIGAVDTDMGFFRLSTKELTFTVDPDTAANVPFTLENLKLSLEKSVGLENTILIIVDACRKILSNALKRFVVFCAFENVNK